jgi:hypothetical protein
VFISCGKNFFYGHALVGFGRRIFLVGVRPIRRGLLRLRIGLVADVIIRVVMVQGTLLLDRNLLVLIGPENFIKRRCIPSHPLFIFLAKARRVFIIQPSTVLTPKIFSLPEKTYSLVAPRFTPYGLSLRL